VANGFTRRKMNWMILITAGLFEVVWATALKMSNGFGIPSPESSD